jgi:cation:H+ antiporter
VGAASQHEILPHSYMTESILLLLSLVLLTGGAEFLVRGASAIATRLGLSELVVGLTVVAFGTSAPELAVSVKSALAGQGGIAMGNVIGSNIFNVAAILGISAMICPLAVHLKIVRYDMPIMLAASALFAIMLMTGGGLLRWEGGLLFAALIAYLVWSVVVERRTATPAEEKLGGDTRVEMRLLLAVGLVVAGLALLVFGARLLVDNATSIARRLGVGEAVIGLTIVAAGTSLPELATSVVAALRRQTDIAIGNIVGSNIFNILGIAGIAGLCAPIEPAGISWRDLGVMLVTASLLLPLMRSGFRLVRWEGAVLLALFGGYLWVVWPSN